jgi:hypothetical protein
LVNNFIAVIVTSYISRDAMFANPNIDLGELGVVVMDMCLTTTLLAVEGLYPPFVKFGFVKQN